MSYVRFVLLLHLGVLLPQAQAGEAPTPEELVRQLGADDFDLRQAAAEKLEALGEKARAALVKARRSEALEIRATVEQLLERLRSAQLVLQVVDEDGKPCPKLSLTGNLNPANFGGNEAGLREVALARARRNANAPLETDADGFLRLESDKPGPHTLYLGAQRTQSWNRSFWQPFNLDLRSGENRAYWIHAHGAVLKGSVVSAKTGEPLADAEVMVRREDGASVAAVLGNWPAGQNHPAANLGSTDAKGQFSVENVSPASLRIFARHNDYAPAPGPALIVGECRAYTLDEPIRLTPKAEAWGRLRVQVLDGNGKPSKGAKVSLRLTPVRPSEEDPQADAQGGAWMVWQQRFQNRQPVGLNANDEGWAETELLEPGAYRVVLQPGDPAQGRQDQEDGRVDLGEVLVKAGQTVSVPGRTASKSGSLSIRLKADEAQPHGMQPVRVFALRLDDPDVKSWMSQPAAIQPWILNMLLNHDRGAQYVHQPNQEVELRNLMPGRYALGFHSMRDQRIGWVFGVEVKAGDRTVVPEIDLTESADPKDAGAPRTLSGVLLGENGRPVSGMANWSLRGRNFSNSSNTAAHFSINVRQGGPADTLTFTCSGYRPYTLDLRKPIPNPNNLVIRMVRQKYGNLTVTVRDPDGKPLEDATVMPISAARKTPNRDRAAITGPEGTARLTGLAFGPREIVATLDGYYLPEPARVEIEADQSKELAIVLRPGKTVAGRVVTPPGVDPAHVLVWSSRPPSAVFGHPQDFWRCGRVDAEGRFAIEGLPPGTLKLRAQAPGFVSGETTVTVGEAGEPVLNLARATNVLVDLGSGVRGSLLLLKSGTWKPQEFFGTPSGGFSALLDGNGKAVVPDVIPGIYDLIFTPAPATPVVGLQMAAQVIASGVQVEGGATTFPLRQECRVGAATLVFQVDMADKAGSPFGYNRVQHGVIIEGAKACAYMHLSDLSGQMPRKPWFTKGTPPEGFPSGDDVQRYRVGSLPGGEYRIHLCRNTWNRRQVSQEKPVLLKTVTVEDGGTLDMGRIEFPVPQADDEGAEADLSLQVGEDESDEDKALR